MASQFPILFSPIQVGPLTLRNRIVNPAHGTGFARGHIMTEQHLYYHEARAKGGVAMTITEAISIHPTSNTGGLETVWGFEEANVPWYRRLSETMHQHGAYILGQLLHMGRQSGGGEDMVVWAPSAIAPEELPYGAPQVPHEMQEEEINELLESYARCAVMLREGGMDGVEIHAAAGNLIHQFFSPLTNTRTDHYGGNLENRARFAQEVIDSVRRAVGKDWVVGLRVSGDELVEGGFGLHDMQEICRKLTSTGQVDYINVIVGTATDLRSMAYSIPSIYIPPAKYADTWAGLRKVVDVPVIGVGRINSPELAEQLLAEGKADLVGMVRALICDPSFPKKALEGRVEDIRPCVACLQSCLGKRLAGGAISCIHHPETGREKRWASFPKPLHSKRVVVVGGGPAGMAAARKAAKRGHQVTLFEKRDHLGGQVWTAARAPHRDTFGKIAIYAEALLRKLEVNIQLGVEASPEVILRERPDAVIIASGSDAVVPATSGNGSTKDGIHLVDVQSVLENEVEPGASVLVVDTQGLHPGSDVAEFLGLQGKKVTIATTQTHVGANVEHLVWRILYQRLLERGIEMLPFTGFKGVEGPSVVLYNTITRKEFRLDGIETVVFATERRANNSLYKALKGKVPELYAVGDCLAPRGVEQAIYDGEIAAMKI